MDSGFDARCTFLKSRCFSAGSGTTLQNLIDERAAGRLRDISIDLVIGSRAADAFGLTRCRGRRYPLRRRPAEIL